MKKIFVTGGHLTPALAVIEVLLKRNWNVYYVGRKHSLEGDSALSQEWLSLSGSEVIFLLLITGRLQRAMTLYTFFSLLKIPLGFIASLYYLIRHNPRVILTFGGYMAVPIVIWGWILRIPVVIHEQTLLAGLANRVSARFATKICLAWAKTQKQFSQQAKIVFTGNPLRKEIFMIQKNFVLQESKPVIYITGGNLGAHVINQVIEENLERLLSRYEIIHQAGNSKMFDDFSRLYQKSRLLPPVLKSRYHLFAYVPKELIGFVFSKSDVIVSRAGANIVSEVIALEKPAILIPLPWSGSGEQETNAGFLSYKQAGETIEQKDLTFQLLLNKIEWVLLHKNALLQNLAQLHRFYVPDAAEKVAGVVESVV